MTRPAVATALVLAACSLAAAQPEGTRAGGRTFAEPMITDRPDFTESAETVPAGSFQLEAGFTFTGRSGPDEHSVGEVLLRHGLTPLVELRVEFPSLVLARGSGEDETGLGDASIGAKFGLGAQEGWRPALGLIAAVVLPTGTEGMGDNAFIPEATLAWSYDLAEGLSVAGNLNFALPEDEDDDRFLEPGATLALGIDATDRVGLFVEYFGFYPDLTSDLPNEHYADAGATYLVSPNFQLDVRVGVGLNSDADDVFAGAGFAVRW